MGEQEPKPKPLLFLSVIPAGNVLLVVILSAAKTLFCLRPVIFERKTSVRWNESSFSLNGFGGRGKLPRALALKLSHTDTGDRVEGLLSHYLIV